MAKKKKLTQREIKFRRELKKEMQEKGYIPPDKPRLNRKKFSKEVREEWDEKGYMSPVGVTLAMSVFANTGELTRITSEELGVLKMMKCAMLIDDAMNDAGKNGTDMTYGDIFELIRPVLEM